MMSMTSENLNTYIPYDAFNSALIFVYKNSQVLQVLNTIPTLLDTNNLCQL